MLIKDQANLGGGADGMRMMDLILLSGSKNNMTE
jgi:hypothetical protein